MSAAAATAVVALINHRTTAGPLISNHPFTKKVLRLSRFYVPPNRSFHKHLTGVKFRRPFSPVMEWQDCTVKTEIDVPISVAYKCYSDREAIPKWMPFISSVKGLYKLQKTDDTGPSCLKLLLKPGHFHTAACDSVESLQEEVELDGVGEKTRESADIFREWGCSESDISKIFERRSSLRKMNIDNLLSKLGILSRFGIKSTDLVKMVHCRPRLLNCKINVNLEERLIYLENLFGSREVLVKAIVRNPSLLIYDFHNKVKPVIGMYELLGLSQTDLITVLLSRPTLIPRTNLNEDKIEYIRRTGVSKESKMYKHVVSIIAISRMETIRAKVMNMEKYGLSEDDYLSLIGRSPLVLTLSVDKVQRNMTYILGTMKLSASVVLHNPFLIYFNLETVLKPRFQVACKVEDMGLAPQIKGALLLRSMRMSEERFIKAFLSCHPDSVAEELLTTYKDAKCEKIGRVLKEERAYRFPILNDSLIKFYEKPSMCCISADELLFSCSLNWSCFGPSDFGKISLLFWSSNC